MKWSLIPFDKLDLSTLYDILKLRANVFVVEQKCSYLDLDNYDQKAQHLVGRNEQGVIIAGARIFAPGIKYEEASFGRFVVSPTVRKTGCGKEMLDKVISEMTHQFGEIPIRIGAQKYLEKFYEKADFKSTGHDYLEDEIPHVEMVRG